MSFRRTAPNFYRRVVAGYPLGVAVLLALYTVIGATFQYLPIEISIGAYAFAVPKHVYGSLALFGPVVVAIVAAYVRGKFEAIPAVLLDELSQDGKYHCRPCTSNNLRVACEIVRPFFGQDHVDWQWLEQWRLKNPQGFMQIENDQGFLAACFVVLGIDNSFFDGLIAGNVIEGQIDGDTVLPMREAKKQPRIYISGVMVRDPGSHIGAKRARVMIWCMLRYIRHHFGLNRELFAVSLTSQSEKLLRSLGFVMVTPAEKRRDHHNFYKLQLTQRIWNDTHNRLGDLRACCSVEFSTMAK